MATFQFELVAPERILYSGQVEAVELPASEGDMTVLAGHAPAMTTLQTGFLVIAEGAGKGRRILVQGGFADIGPGLATVLAERAMPAEELSAETLDAEIKRARMIAEAMEEGAGRQDAQIAIARLEEAKATLRG
jgi:F-type H+-transporting ATPase subunit epsilon